MLWWSFWIKRRSAYSASARTQGDVLSTIKRSKVMRDALDTAYEIVKLVKSLHVVMRHFTSSSKKCLKFHLVSECSAQQDGPLGLMLCRALFLLLWSSPKAMDRGNRFCIKGVASCMNTSNFVFFFGTVLGDLELLLSRTLDFSSMSAAEGQKIAAMAVATSQSIRSDENWFVLEKNYQDGRWRASSSSVPKLYDDGSHEGDFQDSVGLLQEALFWSTWSECPDWENPIILCA